MEKRLGSGVEMKVYHHIIIIIALALLTYFLYGVGLGVIPFLLTTIYLLFIAYKELKDLKRTKNEK